MVSGARVRAKKKGHDFDLTVDWVKGLLEKQAYRCAISGERFDLSSSETRNRARTPSIDRIASHDGYTRGNVRLTTTIVNLARLDWPEEEFLRMCRAVIKSRGPANKPKSGPRLSPNQVRYTKPKITD